VVLIDFVWISLVWLGFAVGGFEGDGVTEIAVYRGGGPARMTRIIRGVIKKRSHPRSQTVNAHSKRYGKGRPIRGLGNIAWYKDSCN